MSLVSLKNVSPIKALLRFFDELYHTQSVYFISTITQGELLAGVHKLYNRKDIAQAKHYEAWIYRFLDNNLVNILDFNQECAESWAELMGKNPQNAVDKQIGATALTYDLTLVTRNVKHFVDTPVKLLNPFYE